jgi:hypothetical protein
MLIPYIICRNYRFLTQNKVQIHFCQKGFMLNYLVWCDHGKAEELPVESDGNDDKDRMDEMVADIGRENRRRCRISIGSLSPQMRKCTMAPM